VLNLVPESPGVLVPSGDAAATLVLEGTVLEPAKGKRPESVRYRSLAEEK
jgi:hypothetical protein